MSHGMENTWHERTLEDSTTTITTNNITVTATPTTPSPSLDGQHVALPLTDDSVHDAGSSVNLSD